MKRFLLLLTMCCLLCGCSSVFDGSYHSRTFHEEQGSHIQSTTITASDPDSLRTVMEDLVSSGTTPAVINVTDFEGGKVESAMATISDYIRTTYPLGAWAVDQLEYEVGPSGSMHAISVNISYLRSRAELRRVLEAPPVLHSEEIHDAECCTGDEDRTEIGSASERLQELIHTCTFLSAYYIYTED